MNLKTSPSLTAQARARNIDRRWPILASTSWQLISLMRLKRVKVAVSCDRGLLDDRRSGRGRRPPDRSGSRSRQGRLEMVSGGNRAARHARPGVRRAGRAGTEPDRPRAGPPTPPRSDSGPVITPGLRSGILVGRSELVVEAAGSGPADFVLEPWTPAILATPQSRTGARCRRLGKHEPVDRSVAEPDHRSRLGITTASRASADGVSRWHCPAMKQRF